MAVLIETLWNVKLFWRPQLLHFCLGINRNIVECKAGTVTEQRCSVNRVLIETLWNVKFFYDGIWRDRPDRINRNIVECKDFINVIQKLRSESINRNIVECKVTDKDGKILPWVPY